MGMKLAHSLSAFSAYKRCEAHLTTKTTHGAVVTLLGVLLGVILTIHEVSYFLSGGGVAQTAVDLARRHDLGIHVDITFPAVPCAGLSVDVMDASGSTGNDVSKGKDVTLHKIRLDPHGKKIGGRDSEYHTPQSQKMMQDKQGTVMQIDLGAALSQMSDMEREIQTHEGCRVIGDMSVRRVAGKLHFAVHQQSFVDVLPQMLTGHVLPKLTNMSHIIHKVAFGPEFPGQVNPLDGFNRVTKDGDSLRAYKYFLKIVPTEYMSRMGIKLETNQYSVSEFSLGLAGQKGVMPSNDSSTTVTEPFVDFSYDLSPIMMTVAQSPQDMLRFLVRLCAVVGGVLSITRMADKLVHGVLVTAGVFLPPPSIKAKHRNSSAGGFSSGRNSYAGSMVDNLNGPASGRSSYAGSSSLLPDGAYHRGPHSFSGPGSHPLSGFNSNSSSLAGMGSFGGAPLSHSNSIGGAGGMMANGGSFPSSGNGASVGGAGSFPSSIPGSQGGSPKAGAGNLGGFNPAATAPLYTPGSLSSGGPSSAGGSVAVPMSGYGSEAGMGVPRNGLGPNSRGGVSAAGNQGPPTLGSFGSGPLVGVAGHGSGGGHPAAGVMAGLGSSRLSAASGPESRAASGPGAQGPLVRGLSTMPGSPLKQQ